MVLPKALPISGRRAAPNRSMSTINITISSGMPSPNISHLQLYYNRIRGKNEELDLDEVHSRIVEGHTPPHRVKHGGILEIRVKPHRGIKVHASAAARATRNNFDVNGNIGGSRRPVAKAQNKCYDNGLDRL